MILGEKTLNLQIEVSKDYRLGTKWQALQSYLTFSNPPSEAEKKPEAFHQSHRTSMFIASPYTCYFIETSTHGAVVFPAIEVVLMT